MSDLWICREQTAKRPFLVEMDGTEIRTIEELCFYLYRSMEYLDESIMGEPLYTWLSEEIALPRLAATLRQEQERGRDVLWCAWFLMQEVGMYSEEELEDIKSACMALENKDEFERQKLKADRLLMNKKYIRCIQEYEHLLHLCESNDRYLGLQGDIWHNKGVAHTRLFLFQEAAECFQRAYERNRREESLKAYEKAVRLAEHPVEQDERPIRLAEHPVEQDERPIGLVEHPVEQDEHLVGEYGKESFQVEAVDEKRGWEERLYQLREEYKKKVI